MRIAPLNAHIVDTAARDGIQRRKPALENRVKADLVMRQNGGPHIANNLDAGIENLDTGSIVSPLAAPTMRALHWSLPKICADVPQGIENAVLQVLIMSARARYVERAKYLFDVGALHELAFVHSHDPYVLWLNSGVRKMDGTRIPIEAVEGEVDSDLVEAMRQVSRKRYEDICKCFDGTGIPINVYAMNATGGRNRDTLEPEFVDPEVPLGEMAHTPPLNGGRHIICDTEAIGTPDVIEKLMSAARSEVGEAVGIHLHMLNTMPPNRIQEIVKAALRPLHNSDVADCFVETGVSGLGGCTAFDMANQNAPIVEVVKAVDCLVAEGNAKWEPGRPNLDIIKNRVTPHVMNWDRKLRQLEPREDT